MKKNTLILILILLGKFVFSQQNYFTKRYNFEKYNNCFSVIPYQDKYFILVPSVDSNIITHFNIGQVDSSGNLLWAKLYSEPYPYDWTVGAHGSLEFYDDSTLFMSGGYNHNHEDVLLNKFNLQGDTLWRKVYGDTTYFQNGWQAKKTRDGGFAIVVNTNEYSPNGVNLIRTDSSGNMLWQKHYGGSQENIAVALDTTIDGGFVMAGGTMSLGVPSSSRCSEVYCIKTDSSGNLQWQKNFGGIYADVAWSVIQCKDSSIVVAGFHSDFDPSPSFYCNAGSFIPYVLKLNQQGDTIWTRTYGESKWNTTIRKIRELPDGSLIAAGQITRDSTYKTMGLIIKIAANGDSIWYHTYTNLQGIWSSNDLYDIRPTNDGGFIACGTVVANPPDSGGQDGWILKIDSNGCEVFNCLFNSVNDIIDSEDQLLIFPNPSAGIFSIRLLEKLNINRWEVYDVLGKIVLSGKELPEEFNLEKFDSGIYFYRIQTKDSKVISGKLVKE